MLELGRSLGHATMPHIIFHDEWLEPTELFEFLGQFADSDGPLDGAPPDPARNRLKLNCKAVAVVGLVRLLDCWYLHLITKSTKAGEIGGHDVYTCNKAKLVMFAAAPERDEARSNRYANLFESVKIGPDFYFSYTRDLSWSMQQTIVMSLVLEYQDSPLTHASVQLNNPSSYNERFCWNFEAAKTLMTIGGVPSQWVQPLLHGVFLQEREFQLFFQVMFSTEPKRRCRCSYRLPFCGTHPTLSAEPLVRGHQVQSTRNVTRRKCGQRGRVGTYRDIWQELDFA